MSKQGIGAVTVSALAGWAVFLLVGIVLPGRVSTLSALVGIGAGIMATCVVMFVLAMLAGRP
jgi:hypothetical protein